MSTRPYVVALTGGIGSGKSTVADGFAARGAALVDADAIAHQLTAPGGAALPAIVASFGASMLKPDGSLDRARMRSHAFSEPQAKQQLEAILHPMIGRVTRERIAQAQGPYVIWVVPLLFESGQPLTGRAERALVVDCPEALQISRVMARSGLTRDEVERIMAHQITRTERLKRADDILDNSGPIEDLAVPIADLHAAYLAYARKHHA